MWARTPQATLFPELEAEGATSEASSSTYLDNVRLPVHRWFRFSAGFSGAWVRHLIVDAATRREIRVFDPFVGSGTTLISAEDAGVIAGGMEAHPFVFRVACAKLARRCNPADFRARVSQTKSRAAACPAELERYPTLIRRCYSDDALRELDRLRRAIAESDDGTEPSELLWLALAAILRRCSHAGTAPWQYVLPRKSKKSPAYPMAAFEEQVRLMLTDMAVTPQSHTPRAILLKADARECAGVPDRFATLVVTSPPYPNNYDYADATRLEMCFFGEINGWGDLQSAVRRHLVRSCTQHVPERAMNLHALLADPSLSPIRRDLSPVCERLAEARLSKGGRKTYHLMIACYFLDLARTWSALRRVCDTPSRICFVVGDSAPYGVHVPVMDWLGRLAVAAGFRSYRFERTRDRNVKWKNRKHRVPLCEGRLWIEG